MKCCDCAKWCGRCRLNKPNKIAWSWACGKFEPKYDMEYFLSLPLEVTA